MDINGVVQRAIEDPHFAKTLRETAAKAQAGGSSSPEWGALLKHFKTNSRELAELSSVADCGNGSGTGAIVGGGNGGGSGTGAIIRRGGGGSGLTPLIDALQEQLKSTPGCTSSGTTAVVGALQAMHFHAKPK